MVIVREPAISSFQSNYSGQLRVILYREQASGNPAKIVGAEGAAVLCAERCSKRGGLKGGPVAEKESRFRPAARSSEEEGGQ